MDPNPRASLERQQLRLRERQKFFEDILQPETEFVFPLSHLHLEAQRRKSWGEGIGNKSYRSRILGAPPLLFSCSSEQNSVSGPDRYL